MTLHSMYKRDDSRTVYRIMAEQAVKYFDHPNAPSDNRILFTNLVRLLERYRYNAFSDDVAPGILEVLKNKNDARRTDYGVTARKKSLDVIPALEQAHARVYNAMSKDDLVEMLRGLLSRLVTGGMPAEPEAQKDFENVRLFFVTLSEVLKEQHT